MLAEHYGLKFVSGGDIFRAAAQEQGMTMDEFDVYMKEHPEARVDARIDGLQREMGEQEDSFLLESRLGWYLVPHSIKIKIDGELDERIRRIANVKSEDRIAYTQDSFEETKRKTMQRFEAHKAKIFEIYGIEDLVADEHFDIVIDSTGIPADEVTRRAVEALDAFVLEHPEHASRPPAQQSPLAK